MFCKYCGKEIPENSEFCRYCGKRINVSEPEVNLDKATATYIEDELYKDKIEERKNLISNYFYVFSKLSDLSGRASRREYWLYWLAELIVLLGSSFILSLIVALITVLTSINLGGVMNGVTDIFLLFTLLPDLSVSVRRMHDVNKSGWYIFIPIYSLILYLRKGDSTSNKFGPPPKY